VVRAAAGEANAASVLNQARSIREGMFATSIQAIFSRFPRPCAGPVEKFELSTIGAVQDYER
jgi:hypothetical protein